MDLQTLLHKIRAAISTELEIDSGRLSDYASLRRDYGLDSVAAVNILFALESDLEVSIDIKRFAGADSIEDLRRLLAPQFEPTG
jgi:acyl carrier protein